MTKEEKSELGTTVAQLVMGLTAERDEWRQAAEVEADLRREAHAEIERLRAALAYYAKGDKQTVDDGGMRARAALSN